MSFFGLNLHAMLAAVSAQASAYGYPEASDRIDSVVAFFNEHGFPSHACITDLGLKWEALDTNQQNQISTGKQATTDMNQPREGYVRVTYFGRVVYAKPIMVHGDISNPDTGVLFQIADSIQQIPLPVQFVLFQDKERFKKLISELANPDGK